MKTTREFIDHVRDLAASADKWPADIAKRERAIAQQMMNRHDHDMPISRVPAWERQMVWENCGACVLARTGRDGNDAKQMPNYAGWLRCYIQAGEAVPQAWLEVELADAETSNPAYYKAILRDIATYGIHRAHHTRERAARGWTPDLGIESESN